MCVAHNNKRPQLTPSPVGNNFLSQKLYSALQNGIGTKNKKFSAPMAHSPMENGHSSSITTPTATTKKAEIEPPDSDIEEKKKPDLDLREVWKNTFGVRDPLTWLATRREELGFEESENDDGEKKKPKFDLREVWKNTFGVRDPLTWCAEHRDELGYE